jgi:histidyl-tRNA synthetase
MNFERVKGTRDFTADEMKLRESVISQIKTVFEKRGFKPLQTPAMEKWETLAGKDVAGEELISETYNWEDQGDRRIGLRYDLTVPMARFIAMNPHISLPFKRYACDRVWRYEKIREGRYREFYQFDIDVVGSSSMLAEAECISTAIEALETAFKGTDKAEFVVKINNRRITQSILESLGITKKEQLQGAMRSIDKIQKLSKEELHKEFAQYNIPTKTTDSILKALDRKGKPAEILKTLDENLAGVNELMELIKYLKSFNVLDKIEIDLTIVRGISYYTGTVYETFFKGREDLGSICSGGRYDKLLEIFTGKELPAVGISIGIERVIDLLKDKTDVSFTVDYFVANVDKTVLPAAIEIAEKLRKKDSIVEIDLMDRKFGKQLDYANKINAMHVVIVGSKDLAEGKVTVKNMQTGKEEKRALKEL